MLTYPTGSEGGATCTGNIGEGTAGIPTMWGAGGSMLLLCGLDAMVAECSGATGGTVNGGRFRNCN